MARRIESGLTMGQCRVRAHVDLPDLGSPTNTISSRLRTHRRTGLRRLLWSSCADQFAQLLAYQRKAAEALSFGQFVQLPDLRHVEPGRYDWHCLVVFLSLAHTSFSVTPPRS